MIALSIPVIILGAIGFVQVGVVLGMWLKTMLGGGYDFDEQEGGE